MTPRSIAKREIDPLWQAVYLSLRNCIEYRERELRELHAEYIEQQRELAEAKRLRVLLLMRVTELETELAYSELMSRYHALASDVAQRLLAERG